METTNNGDFQAYEAPLQLEEITAINYSGADIGDNPAVNLGNGRLRYALPDIAVGNGSMAINVTHIYNSKLNTSFTSNCKGVGYGWKLNVHQSLISDYVDSNKNRIVKYMDENGEIHRFVQYDGNKYYDDRNAKTVLYYSSNSKYITDGVGNVLHFDSNGLLSKIVSCHNAALEKRFTYDTNGCLTSICTVNGSSVKGKITLEYNSDGFLSEMTSYSKTGKKLYGLRYSYVTEGDETLLAKVEQVAYDITPSASARIPKQLFTFEYSDNYLSRIINAEAKESFSIKYGHLNKVTKVQIDAIAESGIPTGFLDKNNQSPVALGCVNSGMAAKTEYVCKTYKEFSYIDLNEYDTLSVETDVTNEKGVKIAYFISRDACIVSSFEKISNGNLFTLTKQGALKTNNSTTSTLQQINGAYSLTAYNGSFIREIRGLNISRNYLEKKCQYYDYSFWLKIPSSYERLQVETSVKYLYQTDELHNTVWVDGKAQEAWQRVALPLALPLDDEGNPITDGVEKITISFKANGKLCEDTFVYNEIGFAPSPNTDLQLAISSSKLFIPLKLAETVKINSGTPIDIQKSTNTYFTENDIIATFTNKYAHPYTFASQACYDAICNNGTKRIANVCSLQFGFYGNVWSDESKAVPFRLFTVSTMPNSQVITNYKFSTQHITIENVATSVTGKETTTATLVDYKGKMLEEKDEYNVRKVYAHDKYGNVKTITTVDSEGVVRTISSADYDDDGRLSSSDNGLTGQKTTYNEYDQVHKVIETKLNASSGKFEETSHSNETRYGAYKDKPIRCIEHSADTNTGSTNTVIYEDGQIRAVGDNLVKYGMKFDRKTNSVAYTQFDGNVEKTVQKDSVTYNGSSGETHETSYFDESGSESEKIVTSVNKYGKIGNIKHKKGQGSTTTNVIYSYPSLSESTFAAKPETRQDLANGITTKYNYDSNGNLIGWDENLSGVSTEFSIRQVSDGITKYTFDENEEYFTEIEYDSDKVFSPRIVGTRVLFDGSKKYDNPTEISKKAYTYDELGRLTNSGACKYEYESLGTSYVLDKEVLSFSKTTLNSGGMLEVDSNYDIKYSYDDMGKIIGISQLYSWQALNSGNPVHKKSGSVFCSFSYDSLHRIVHETNSSMGIDNEYIYKNGRLSQIIGKYNSIKSLQYDSLGRLSSFHKTRYTYDVYGNRTSKQTELGNALATYGYEFGDRLVTVNNGKDISYKYNADGVRCQKTVGALTTNYFLDGNKIVGENRGNNKLRYFYDTTGLALIRYNGNYYTYCCDALGNVVFLLDSIGVVAARYEYDIWGNCTVYDIDNKLDKDTNSIGNINPFRWKSFYYDNETGLYYANGSYYDPEVGLYLDAAPISTVMENAYNPRCLDRNGLMCDNPLELACNPHTIFTATELHVDPVYDSYANLPWWVKAGLWFKKAMADLIEWFNNLAVVKWYNGLSNSTKAAIGAGLLAFAILLAFFTGGVSEVVSVLVEVAIGIGVGIRMWALSTLVSGQKLTKEGLASAAVDSFVFSSLFACVHQFANLVKSIARSSPNPQAQLKDCTTNCFIAGTLVLCEGGYKKIEDIQLGDKVLAYNEETGEQGYKAVVNLFRNTSKDWIGLTVNGEEIVSTPGHKYFLPETKQWVSAADLQVGSIILLSTGKQSRIELKREIHYDTPQTTYNFEVEDFHTYYVGVGVLVHNKNCSVNQMNEDIKRGRAPKEIESVHQGNTNTHTQPHAHFTNGTSLNIDGTIHDQHGGIPQISKQARKWLIKYGWEVPKDFWR